VSAITTHVLDLALGRPAAGVAVRLERHRDTGWELVAQAPTDGDGRVSAWPGAPDPTAGTYRLTFATGPYHAARRADAFHPEVTVVFRLGDRDARCHVPLLLSPYGYSTYRGT
jgi:5-hydroxyisourate hydrolase